MSEHPHDTLSSTGSVDSATNDGSVAHTVARELSAATGRDALDLEPLGAHVDMDAVESLVASGDESLSIMFTHAEHRVMISGTGDVDVFPRSSVGERR